MTTEPRVPRTELTGIHGRMLTMAMRKMVGKVPDSAQVMWHHPTVFTDLMKVGRRVERWDRVEPALAAYAAMAAAAEIGCGACLDINYFMAHHRGLDVAKLREVPRWRDSDAFTPVERRVMEYAEAMCQTPLAVTDEMSAALLEELGPAALLELTARIGFLNMSARSNIALGIPSEHFADSCALPPLAARSTA